MDAEQIELAATLLRAGKLVAFATETVYGLGADATNASAVARIFAAKGRPGTNPLIVHVANADAARRWVLDWPVEAEKLARAFWPGPLTLVLPKAAAIVDGVTAGLSTVGIRVPNHPLALALLAEFDGPVAAPSANRSNRISPTTAEHVRAELGEAVDLILDGGSCEVGIESTVLDLSSERPTILRPGQVTAEKIAEVIGRPVGLGSVVLEPSKAAASPGQHRVHYSPTTATFYFSPPAPAKNGAGYLLLRCEEPVGAAPVVRMPGEPRAYAQRLYAALRELDALGLSAILVEMPPEDAEWMAVRDRLRRAGREFLPTR